MTNLRSDNNHLHLLADWRKRKQEHEWLGEGLDAELAGLIQDAKEDGVPVARIAEALEVSRQAIYLRMRNER